MKLGTRLAAVFLLFSVLLGNVWAESTTPAALSGILGEQKLDSSIAALVARVELDKGESVRAIEIGRDPHTSHHLVSIREGERMHWHELSDQTVIMLRGYGTFRFGTETKNVGEHSILHVPRKTVHAFQNESNEPAVAYVIYTPPLAANDRVFEDD